jgi:flagellar protein FliJ
LSHEVARYACPSQTVPGRGKTPARRPIECNDRRIHAHGQNELDREIGQEERRANIDDPNHFAYPTYARAARTRRDNILASIAELRGQLEEAEAQFKEASEDFAKAQSQEARDRGAERMVDVVAERRHAEMPEVLRRV